MRIYKYFEEARVRARRRKSPWNLILLPFAFAGMAAAYFLLLKGVVLLQGLQVPKDIILSGNTRIGNIFKYCALLPAALPWGFILANILAFCVRPARETFEREAQGHKGASFKEANRDLFKAGVVLTLLMFPLSVAGALNYFYVTPNGITYNSVLSRKSYPWQDIKRVYVACYIQNSRSSWVLELEYKLHMADGVNIDLWEENYDRFAEAYNQIAGFIKEQRSIIYLSKITPAGLHYLAGSRYDRIRPVMIKIIQENKLTQNSTPPWPSR